MRRQAHVLLVEDNMADIELTRDMLVTNQRDIKFSVAKDGVEAIDFLCGNGDWSKPGPPTLILLDLNLPRKDGRQVLAVLKGHEDLRRIPVIVLSSSESEMDVTNCYHLGANCYIVKPMDLKAYRAIVKAVEEFWLARAVLPRREGHSAATAIGYGQ